MDTNDPAPFGVPNFWTMAAALAGSLLCLRTIVESSPWARMFAVISSFLFSFFVTPWVAEYWEMSYKGERAVSLLIAFAGVNVLAAGATFLAKLRDDPKAAVEWLVSLWRGRTP